MASKLKLLTKGQRVKYSAIGGTAGIILGGGIGLFIKTTLEMDDPRFNASDFGIKAPKLPWSHNGWNNSFDHASIRRGYAVYKNVCSACHSMEYVQYRSMVDVLFTEAEAKAEAAEVMVLNMDPDLVEKQPNTYNEMGEPIERPGRLIDKFPSPYPNGVAAAYANNGAIPPDLSFISLARKGGEDYIYHLLTSYCEAPAGVHLDDGQHFNPYFPGGVLAMAPPLYSEIIEYEDGTPATQSQLAKDVCTFLTWVSMPEHDQRKRAGTKLSLFMPIYFAVTLYCWRHKMSLIKFRKVVYTPPRR